jgi:universal stress protein E
MPARRILFAIRDPEAKRQPGLAKAIQVAQGLGASLELFHALTDALIIEPSRFEYDAVDRLRERVESQARISLLRLCTMAGKHGVPASLAVEWDRLPYEAIVRRATEIGADLIIAECHKGARTRPWLIHLTDWELLRTSPLPVLLLKGAKPYHRPLVLAAVDPAHSHAKPLALDTRILAAAGELGKGLRGTLHVMHANQPSIVGVDPEIASKKATSTWSTLTFKELQDQERQAFEDFRARAGVPRTRAHLVNDNPAVAIVSLARELNADIVAMGALSRSGLARVFIGNTAERVLDDLPCDVLVVKPVAFAKRMEPERQVSAPAASVGQKESCGFSL